MEFDSTVNVDTILTFFVSLITFLVFRLSLKQLTIFNKTSSSQFLHNLYNTLFVEETTKLITVIHANCLEFDQNNDFPLFRVNRKLIRSIYPVPKTLFKEFYTTYEIDLLLLNPLDSIGSHVKSGVVEMRAARQYFKWHVDVTWNCIAVQQYLNWLRDVEQSGFVFQNVELLYLKFKEEVKPW